MVAWEPPVWAGAVVLFSPAPNVIRLPHLALLPPLGRTRSSFDLYPRCALGVR